MGKSSRYFLEQREEKQIYHELIDKFGITEAVKRLKKLVK